MIQEEERPTVYHFERAFTRNVGRGMKVQFGRTVTPARGMTIDHYELSMPGYDCTDNGPKLIEIENVEETDDVCNKI